MFLICSLVHYNTRKKPFNLYLSINGAPYITCTVCRRLLKSQNKSQYRKECDIPQENTWLKASIIISFNGDYYDWSDL